jgi:MFS transporter, DHA3 family, macrolide efflux protein
MDLVQKRNLMLFISGRLVSLIGCGIQLIALPLYILDKTGSGAMMGLFSVASMLPALLMTPVSGIVGDRYNRKYIMVITDISRGLLIVVLAIMAFSEVLTIVWIFTIQVLISVLDSLFNSSGDAFLPDIVSRDALTRATAIKGGADGLSYVIGPIIGSVIYGLFGIKVVFVINALSYIVSGVWEGFIKYEYKKRVAKPLTAKIFFHEIAEVGHFIHSHKGLKIMFVFACVVNLLLYPVFTVVLPYAYKQTIGFSDIQYGYLNAFFMGGLLLGNIIMGTWLHKTRFEKLIKTGVYLESTIFALFSIMLFPIVIRFFQGASWGYFWLLGLFLLALGLNSTTINVPVDTSLQKMVKPEMRSRFFAVKGLLSMIAAPLGALVFGLMLDRFPVHWILVGISTVVLFGTIVFTRVATSDIYDEAEDPIIQQTS